VEGPLKEYLGNPAVHIQHVITGVMFGVLLGGVTRSADSGWLRSRSFGWIAANGGSLKVAQDACWNHIEPQQNRKTSRSEPKEQASRLPP